MLTSSEAFILRGRFKSRFGTQKTTQQKKPCEFPTRKNSPQAQLQQHPFGTLRINNRLIDLQETIPLSPLTKNKKKQTLRKSRKTQNFTTIMTRIEIQNAYHKLVQIKAPIYLAKRKQIQLRNDSAPKKIKSISAHSTPICSEIKKTEQKNIFQEPSIILKQDVSSRLGFKREKMEWAEFGVTRRYQRPIKNFADQKRATSLQVKSQFDCTPWITKKEYFDQGLQNLPYVK